MEEFKRFCKQSLLFILPLVFLLTVVEYRLGTFKNGFNRKKDIFLSKVSEIDTLILGNSRTLGGIDPDYLDGTAFNLSHNAQSNNLSLYLFLKYADKMKNLKTLVIHFDNYATRDLCAGDYSWRCDYYQKYHAYPHRMSLTPYLLFFLYDVPKNVHFLTMPLYSDLLPTQKDNGFLKFEKKGELEKKDAEYLLKFHFGEIKAEDKVDLRDARLEKMLDFAEEKGIRTVLIITPTFSDYFKGKPANYETALKEYAEDLILKYKNVHYLDMERDERFEEGDFKDVYHLSGQGAEKATKILNDYLKNLDSRNAL